MNQLRVCNTGGWRKVGKGRTRGNAYPDLG